MTDLIFFGAGASKPFGIPTMQEMVTEFEKTLHDNEPDLFSYYSKIKKALVDAFGNSSIDIEAMLSVMEGISKNVQPKDLGHFAFYYISQVGLKEPFSSDSIELAKKLLEKLKEYIKNSCTIKLSPSKITEIYERSYVPLFSNFGGAKKSSFHGRYKLFTGWKSYTTNYDDVFENFWNRLQVPQDHFDRLGNSDNYVFNSSRLVLDDHSFVKLHGSLNWTYNKENRNVIKALGTGFTPYETGGDVMLFPIQQKDLYLYPWHALFQDFKSGLMKCEKWYVIGYAFNDEFILNVFIEQLRLRNKPTLVIINPSSNDIIRNFPKDVKDKIISLQLKFGEKKFPQQILDYRNLEKTITIKVKSGSKAIGVSSSHIIKQFKPIHNIETDRYQTHIEPQNVAKTSLNQDSDDYEFELKVDYPLPFKDNIELRFLSGSMNKLNVSVYYSGELLGIKDQLPDTNNLVTGWYAIDKLIIHQIDLFT